jgi:hypothetical protein
MKGERGIQGRFQMEWVCGQSNVSMPINLMTPFYLIRLSTDS